MALNKILLRARIHTAFLKQAAKPGPYKGGVSAELASDISNAIREYLEGAWIILGWGGIASGMAAFPWPGIRATFYIPIGIGVASFETDGSTSPVSSGAITITPPVGTNPPPPSSGGGGGGGSGSTRHNKSGPGQSSTTGPVHTTTGTTSGDTSDDVTKSDLNKVSKSKYLNKTGPCVVPDNIVHLENAMEKFGITNTYARIAILAVISKESSLCPKSEKMFYSKGRLAEVWGRFSKTGNTVPKGQGKFNYNALAEEYSGDDKKLANLVYAGKYGNRKGTSDGYDYRGRGFNQITFRDSYEKYAKIIGVDILSDPDLLNDPAVAAPAAVAFLQNRWKSRSHPYPEYKGSNPQFPDQATANLVTARANAGWGKGMTSSATKRAIKHTNRDSKQFIAGSDGKITLAGA